MKSYRVLHLGAGVQSGAIYALMADGELPAADYAVFSDTQEEPDWVYRQLEWCKSLNSLPIVEVTAGKIGDDLVGGIYTKSGTRFASIPAHTTYVEGQKGGLTRRQCTREYKIEPIERWMRRKMLGLAPRKRIPKDVTLFSQFGFSTDEAGRAVRMRTQFSGRTNWTVDFPLMDPEVLMTRHDAARYIAKRSGFEWRSSRCSFCPLQSNRHWREIKDNDPAAWDRAVEVDNALRDNNSIANNSMDETMYVHRSCVPLERANLDESQGTLFDDGECSQGCFL